MTRENHFNLVRMLAALAVMVSHSFALVSGNMADQPLAGTGIALGASAVDVFFVTSGFLVTASLLRRSLVEFVAARLLRIYPGLVVAMMLTVAVLGFNWSYLWHNALLFPGAPSTIPGAFEGNPIKGVNGSLWTLPYEVRMYAALAVLGLLLGARRAAFKAVSVTIAGAAFGWWMARDSVLAHLAYMFFAGAAFQLLAPKLSMRWAALAASVLVVAYFVGAYRPVYALALPYVVLTLALVPKGPLLAFNRLGDYSYGVYIYAFPVQQLLVADGARSPAVVFAGALMLTLMLAGMSWHLIEKRALAFKGQIKMAGRRRLPLVSRKVKSQPLG